MSVSPAVADPSAQAEAPAIEAHGLVKRYKGVLALDGVSFEAPARSVFCVLGPNGAGKTTLLKILTTMTRPDEGDARILGHDIRRNAMAIRSQIGVVSQDNHFETYFTVWQNLALHAELHGMARETYTPRIEALLRQVDLYDRRHAKCDELSGGMQRRISLIRALIHHPRLLFLDEPTTGLDPVARRQLWQTIADIRDNTAIILTTHYMEEADVLSDCILMMHRGRAVMSGSPQALKRRVTPLNRYELLLRTPQARALAARIDAALNANAGAGGASGGERMRVTLCVGDDPYRLEMKLADSADLSALLTLIEPDALLRVGALEADLEDVFLAVASGASLTGEGA
ncbi:MAG: ABC transporter ATP-binding protein [Vampirovibrionales bacterium]|nr:ABC transporter ATP-binding protein [Vampirovibrionales bacterium]